MPSQRLTVGQGSASGVYPDHVSWLKVPSMSEHPQQAQGVRSHDEGQYNHTANVEDASSVEAARCCPTVLGDNGAVSPSSSYSNLYQHSLGRSCDCKALTVDPHSKGYHPHCHWCTEPRGGGCVWNNRVLLTADCLIPLSRGTLSGIESSRRTRTTLRFGFIGLLSIRLSHSGCGVGLSKETAGRVRIPTKECETPSVSHGSLSRSTSAEVSRVVSLVVQVWTRPG
jgi:hypothetical protein